MTPDEILVAYLEHHSLDPVQVGSITVICGTRTCIECGIGNRCPYSGVNNGRPGRPFLEDTPIGKELFPEYFV